MPDSLIPYTGNAFKIGAIVAGGIILDGAESSAVSTGINKEMVYADGALGPRASFISAIDPQITFTTRNMHILTMTGLRGIAVENIGTGDDKGLLDVYMELLEPNASIYGGAKHFRWRATRGLLVPTQLSCSTDGIWSVQYQLRIASPPQEWPLTVVDSLPLPVLGNIKMYGLGEMFFAVTSKATPTCFPIITKSNVDINMNPRIEAYKRDGHLYPECFYVSGFEPKINITLGDQSLALPANLGRTGHIDKTLVNTPGSCLFMKRRINAGEYYANTEEEHIKLTFAGDYYFEQLAGGNSNEIASTQLTLDVTQTGAASVNEIEITSGIAIPAAIDPASYALPE
jgi:hypothetical protein